MKPLVYYQGDNLFDKDEKTLERMSQDVEPRIVKISRIATDGLCSTFNGPLSGLGERLKAYGEGLFSEYGNVDVSIAVEQTGYFDNSWNSVIFLHQKETHQQVQERVDLATKALAAKRASVEKRRVRALAKKLDRLKADLAEMPPDQRNQILTDLTKVVE